MPVFLQKFLASAQDQVVPAASNPSLLNSFFSSAVGTLSLNKQAKTIEFDELQFSMTTTAAPVFTILSQAIDSISRYKHIGIRLGAGISVGLYFVDVEYPELNNVFNVGLLNVNPLNDPSLPPGKGRSSDFMRQVQNPSLPAALATLSLKKLDVYPRGVLRVEGLDDLVTGSSITLSYVREVISRHSSYERVTGSIVGFQS